MMTLLDDSLRAWLDAHAAALDDDAAQADGLLARLAQAGLFRIGVPEREGGSGGTAGAAIGVIAALARHSLGAAFVAWAQRAVIECVLASPNRALVEACLPALLDGRLAGAPGLSNAMKCLGAFDRLQTRAVPGADGAGGARLHGAVAWATNLHVRGFAIALAVGDGQGDASVYLVPNDAPGLVRMPDLDLAGLRATHTGALRFDGVALDPRWQLHPQAGVFLPRIRPVFIGLQCGLGLGLARASLDAARCALLGAPSVLDGELDALEAAIGACWTGLADGIDGGGDGAHFAAQPGGLPALRVRMVELAQQAVQLELQALGGRAFLRGADGGCLRRWREAAFLPVLTPTLVQLKTQLKTQARAEGAGTMAED
jgi:alkylation response protein AidB-like acyl-CoA dehydrogenase